MKAAKDHERGGEEREHWVERAEHHLGLGEQAADSRASWIHFQLAGRYLDRAYGGGTGADDDCWESRALAMNVQ